MPSRLPLTGHSATEGWRDSGTLATQVHNTAPKDVRPWPTFEAEVAAFKEQKEKESAFQIPCVLPLDREKTTVARSEAAITAGQGAAAFQVVNENLRSVAPLALIKRGPLFWVLLVAAVASE